MTIDFDVGWGIAQMLLQPLQQVFDLRIGFGMGAFIVGILGRVMGR